MYNSAVSTMACQDQQFYDCKICNIRGLIYSSENVQNHFRSKSHTHMKMFYDNNLWPSNQEESRNSTKIFKFLDFKGTIMCELCRQIVLDGSALLKHQHQPEHLKVLIEQRLQDKVPIIFACDACDTALIGHNAYFQHNSTAEHLLKVNTQKYDGCVVYSAQENVKTNLGNAGLHLSQWEPVSATIKQLKHEFQTSSSVLNERKKEIRNIGPVLNVADPFTREILKNLSSNLKNLSENIEKTDMIVAGLIKSEMDFSGADTAANLRQILLRKIAQECKNRRQTRQIVEHVVSKHVANIVMIDEEPKNKNVRNSSRKNSRSKRSRSRRSRSRRSRSRRSRSRRSRSRTLSRKRERSRSRDRSPKQLSKRMEVSDKKRIENFSRTSQKRDEKSTRIIKPNVASQIEVIDRNSDVDIIEPDAPGDEYVIPIETDGETDAKQMKNDMNAFAGFQETNSEWDEVSGEHTKSTKKNSNSKDQDGFVQAKRQSKKVNPLNSDEFQKTSGVVLDGPNNEPQTSNSEIKSPKIEQDLDKISLVDKIEIFYGKSIRELFIDLVRKFIQEFRQTGNYNFGVWDDLSVPLRDVFRVKLYESLKAKLSNVQMKALLIMFDMKLDMFVRQNRRLPGGNPTVSEGSNYLIPMPGEVVFQLESPLGDFWQFEPPRWYYSMLHAVNESNEKMNITPVTVE